MQGFLVSLVLAGAEGPMSPDAARAKLGDYRSAIFHMVTSDGLQAILAGRDRWQFDELLTDISFNGKLLGVYVAPDALIQLMTRVERSELLLKLKSEVENREEPTLLEQLIQIAVVGATPMPIWDPPEYPFWELYLDSECRQCIRIVRSHEDALDLAKGFQIRKSLCRFIDRLDVAEAAMLLVEQGQSIGDEANRRRMEMEQEAIRAMGSLFGMPDDQSEEGDGPFET